MSDAFQITPPAIRAEGKDVPPEQIQAGFNSLARQTQIALNTVATDPTGPAGGDLGGSYPNPTVTGSHITSGTISGITSLGTTGTITTTFNGGGGSSSNFVNISNGAVGPSIAFENTTFGLDAKWWDILQGNGFLLYRAVNDSNSSATTYMTVNRGAGVSITNVTFGASVVIPGGTVDNTTVGATTPSTGAFTTLSASSGLNSTAVGNTTPSTGAFTTLSASSGLNNTAVGNTTPSTGAFTTLSSTGLYTPSTTNGIKGTTLADNANAGSIGELLTNTTTLTSLSSATPANATSVSLTAGDWDVTGLVQFNPAAGTTTSQVVSGISTTSATFATITAGFSNINGGAVSAPAGQGEWVEAPVTRINVSSTTTVFLIAQATFASSTMTASGFIRARRVR